MKPRSVSLLIASVAALAATTGVLAANDSHFVAAPLKAEQEVQVPAVVSDATGVATMKVSKEGDSIRYHLNVANIENVLFSHIHCGPAGVNGPIVAFLYHGPTVTQNGVLATGTITDADVIHVPDSAACPGGVSSLDDLLEKMESGGAYVNVHTTAHPAGEIRGQIK